MGLKRYNYDIKVKNDQTFSNSHKIKSHNCEFESNKCLSKSQIH